MPRTRLVSFWKPGWQSGLNSTPFHRVYFVDDLEAGIERLPQNLFYLPIVAQWSLFIGKGLVSKVYYRYYFDSFGLQAHTLQPELPYTFKKFWTLRPFYRFHVQSSNDYFKPFAEHSIEDSYYTSDWDMAQFTSQKLGMSLQYYPLYPLFGNMEFIELRYLHFWRSDGLRSRALSLGTRFTF